MAMSLSMSHDAAFASSAALSSTSLKIHGAPSLSSRAACVRRTHVSVAKRSLSAARMCASNDDQQQSPAPAPTPAPTSGGAASERKTEMEADADTPISVWGVVSFALIFGIMMVAVLATVARDFVPGGLAPPV